MNAIEIRELTKSYRDFTLDKLNLTLPTGCILGLIGENGAGKTTTLKTLLGIVQPDGGTATVLGTELGGDMSAVKEEVGVVLDEPGIAGCLTARQLQRVLRMTYRSWDDECYDALLKRLSLPEDKPYGEFSRGMKMKLGIAAAMSHKPRLLLLDEPTSGLDPVVRDEVVELFLDFTRDEDHSILISSHIVSDLEKLCDYIAFLHKGRLMLYEEKDTLRSEYVTVQCTAEELAAIPAPALIGRRSTPYGCSAIVRRAAAPKGVPTGSVSIEELFICMAKEDRA